MKFVASLSFAAAVASAASVDLTKRDTPLDVKIEMVGNSAVKASITNTGASALKVFKTGTILDSLAVEKADIFAGAEKVAFDGVRVSVAYTGLSEDAFQTIAGGETVEVEWDVAQVHNLDAGGFFDIAASGAFSVAEEGSTDITSAATFGSNVLTVSVDGAAAAKVRRDFHEELSKRTTVQSDCTGTRRTQTLNALSNCRSLAAAASSAAASGPAAKMTEYFKSSTSATRSTVAGVFGRVASECGSTTSGVSRQYCTDVYPGGACSSGVLAYTVPSQSYMVFCALAYNNLPALTRTCHAQDLATTSLHEVTHLSQIRGTTDQSGCYGYSCVLSLSAAQNLNHADTYSLFANSIYAGC